MPALSKALEKRIRQLRQKKQRDREQQFVAEGDKLIRQLLHHGCALSKLLVVQGGLHPEELLIEETDLRRISVLENPANSLAIFAIPSPTGRSEQPLELYLEDLQDPGNLGTILRTAAWFGHPSISLSQYCADPFSPKVVQASMGAVGAMQIRRESLEELLKRWKESGRQIGIADMQGTHYQLAVKTELTGIIIGNEGNGLSSEARSAAEQVWSIPGVQNGMESLNAAIASAILMAHWWE